MKMSLHKYFVEYICSPIHLQSNLFVKMCIEVNYSHSSHRASGTVFTAIDVATGQEVKSD